MTEGPLVDIPDISFTQVRARKDDTELTLPGRHGTKHERPTAQRNRGNKLETAKRLGIGRQTLYTRSRLTASTFRSRGESQVGTASFTNSRRELLAARGGSN